MNSEDERRLIGANVKRYREALWMSQADVADALRRAGFEGIYPQTITKIEQGQRVVKLAEGVALARLFRIQPGELLSDAASVPFANRVDLFEAVDRYAELMFTDMPRLAQATDRARERLSTILREAGSAGARPESYPTEPGMGTYARPHRDFTWGQLFLLGNNLLKIPPDAMFGSYLKRGEAVDG